MTADSDIVSARNRIQTALSNIANYLRSRGLDVSPSKSRAILFKNSRSKSHFLPLEIGDASVPLVDRIKFLGVVLDRKLTGRAHFEYLLDRGRRIVNIISSLSGVWWGSHPQSLIIIYRALFRSSIEYGCLVFKFKGNSVIFQKIQRLQYRALRTALGYRGSTPIILGEACEPPLKVRMAMLSRKYIYRCIANSGGIVLSYLLSLRSAALSASPSDRARVLRGFPLLSYFISLNYTRGSVFRFDLVPGSEL